MKRLLPFALVALGVAAPASAQVERVIGYNTPGQAYVNYSIGSADKSYNSDGDEIQFNPVAAFSDLPGSNGSNFTTQRIAAGASYNVMQVGNFGLYLGAEFSMAKRDYENASTYTAPAGTLAPIAITREPFQYTSDFKPQNLSFVAGFRGPAYDLHAGYMKDLGPEYGGTAPDLKVPNSDQNDAVVLGGEFYTPFSGLTVTGGANYYLTLKQDQSVNTTTNETIDPADYFDAHLGLGYRVADVAEIGLQARYLSRLEGDVFNQVTTDVEADQSGYALGLVPYLTLSPEFIPAQLTISGSTIQEYTPYGITLLGKSMPVGRRGVTVGLRFGF